MKKTIITAAIGDAEWLNSGVKVLSAYAAKVGAELIVLTETNRSNPQHSLFDAFTLAIESGANADDRFLWMDVDIVPTESSIDLFDYCDPRFLWGSQPIGKSFTRHYIPWARSKFPEISDLQPYLNTGIVSFSASQAAALMEHDEDWPVVGDQEPFNIMWRLAGLPIRMVPNSIHDNWTNAKKDSKTGRFKSFYHCGGGGKARKMRIVTHRTPTIKPLK